MPRRKLAMGCGGCGGFWPSVDALAYARLMVFHRSLTVLGFEDDYERQVASVMEEAEGVLSGG